MNAVRKSKRLGFLLWAVTIAPVAQIANAQETPSDYQQVLKIVGKTGDYKSNVLKVNIPRNDLHMTIAGYSVPSPFGFGGWFAMTKGDSGEEVLMGDLVLTQEEVNPVMSALLDHGHGKATDLADQIKPAVDLIGHAPTAAGRSRSRYCFRIRATGRAKHQVGIAAVSPL